MSRFAEALRSGRVLLMDGGIGTELQRAGLPEGTCPELWNRTHPDRVRTVHQAYADAGAECLVTNTFQANPFALARHALQDHLPALARAGVELARSVSGRKPFVLASVGPFFDGGREVWPDEAILRQIVQPVFSADALLLETFSDPEVFAVVRRIGATPSSPVPPPVLVSIAYRRTPSGRVRSQSGHAPERFARLAREGVAALGVNCGRDIGMAEAREVIRRYRGETDLPLFARPNAGTPVRAGGRWVYPRGPEEMAGRLAELLEAGATLVGGCCGTSPEHIAAFRPVVDQWNARRRR